MAPEALLVLFKRFRVESDESPGLSEEGGLETEMSAVDEEILGLWPGGWPGREIVDLDYVGDPGAWLRDVFGESLLQVLFGCSWDDDSNAEMLAEEYLLHNTRGGIPAAVGFR